MRNPYYAEKLPLFQFAFFLYFLSKTVASPLSYCTVLLMKVNMSMLFIIAVTIYTITEKYKFLSFLSSAKIFLSENEVIKCKSYVRAWLAISNIQALSFECCLSPSATVRWIGLPVPWLITQMRWTVNYYGMRVHPPSRKLPDSKGTTVWVTVNYLPSPFSELMKETCEWTIFELKEFNQVQPTRNKFYMLNSHLNGQGHLTIRYHICSILLYEFNLNCFRLYFEKCNTIIKENLFLKEC